MLEAVERAAAEAKHLRFAPKAFETAAESPFRRPGLVLRTLRGLDDLAGRYDAGDMGKSLGQAAAEHGITQWKPDIAETTRKRYEDDYSFSLDGRRPPSSGSGRTSGSAPGSGAQFIARIYLHVADGSDPDVPRGIIVAVVGRHLPGHHDLDLVGQPVADARVIEDELRPLLRGMSHAYAFWVALAAAIVLTALVPAGTPRVAVGRLRHRAVRAVRRAARPTTAGAGTRAGGRCCGASTTRRSSCSSRRPTRRSRCWSCTARCAG